ncbi:hypothetical protein [Mesorhizobium sp.]|uniref:hypothetical protein n=1 Tax=Mesorhizobium sp. TaxID=1871066 RepID=UPI000FE5BEAF|nr:hypothetical protein [Mesorhizobium sp.]RWO21744.1 MAG: hypothetical protein EOS09_22310 [Mesorhizobium sp.]
MNDHMEQPPAMALAAVKVARLALAEAQFAMDDAGLWCDLLDRLQGATAALAAVWQGRSVPVGDGVPASLVEAAVTWRDERGGRERAGAKAA